VDLRCNCCEIILELQFRLSLFHFPPTAAADHVPTRESFCKGNISPVSPYGSYSSVLVDVETLAVSVPHLVGRGERGVFLRSDLDAF